MPNQVVFRQKPWLPWWMAVVIPLLIMLLGLLYLLLPQSVVVPDVVGKPSEFEAAQTLDAEDLRLAANVKEKVDPEAKPGEVLPSRRPPGRRPRRTTRSPSRWPSATARSRCPT